MMRNLWFILVFLCFQFIGFGQDLFKSIEQQDVNAILAVADAEIDLCILDSQNIYSKQEAGEELNKFFNQYTPSSCEAVHSGSSRGSNNIYQLGKMTSKSGQVFRVFIYANEHDKIIELRIDKW